MADAARFKWVYPVVSGAMLSAAFPKPGLWLFAWVGLVPLILAIRDAGPAAAFRAGFIAGLVHYLTLLYWVVITMRTYGFLPWWQCISLLVLLASYLSLYTGLFAGLLVRFCGRPAHLLLLMPALWVALEYLRSFLLTGFPWGILGYSQFNRLHIIQISDMFGVFGISFLVVLGNAGVSLLLLFAAKQPWRDGGVTGRGAIAALALPLIAVGATLTYGGMRLDAVSGAMNQAASIRVAAVQGNIDQARKWDPAYQIGTTKKYISMTRSAARNHPDLVVWPETATPFYFGASQKLSRLVIDLVRQTGVSLLVGSPSVDETVDGGPRYFNSAYLVAPDGRLEGRYDKVHLVPFGEYVPLKWLLSFVGKMVAQVGDFSAGEKGRTLTWGEGKPPLGVQICFEIIFPGLSRSLVKNGAGLLVNLTNDAWFGKSAAAYQHFSMAVFRAVENRRSLVRCANTGISAIVDPTGRVVVATALFTDAVVDGTVPIMQTRSVYTQIGDILALGCLIGSIVLVVARSDHLRGRGRRIAEMAYHRIAAWVRRGRGR